LNPPFIATTSNKLMNLTIIIPMLAGYQPSRYV
jgi:hypothetical protein